MSSQWGPIQVIPGGLLGLLNIKNRGKNPDTLDSNVVPTIDLTSWWFEARAEDIGTFTRTPVTGNNGFASWSTPVIVPNGQAWWVLEYTVRTTDMGVGDSGQFGCGWQQIATQQRYAVGPLSDINSGVGICVGFARGFYVPAGAELLWWTNDVINATAYNPIGTARIVRLPF